jgi:hypothetical protein
MVRTITHEDVNVADADALFSAGALDDQIRSNTKVDRDVDGMPIMPAISANREPIFKLAWAGFPDQQQLKALMAAQGTEAAGEPLSKITRDYAERGETLLLILGGQSPGERPGINIIQFPAYKTPILSRRGTAPSTPSESMPLPERYAFRDSLMPTGVTNYPTRTPPEDFVLLPRLSPYFNLSHDCVALIVSLTPDPNLNDVGTPHAARGMEAYAFPPPRSSAIPPSPGRKNFVTPGEGEKIVQMTPAPIHHSNPESPRSSSPGGWRLPWTPTTQPSPGLRVPTPDSSMSFTAIKKSRARRRYRLPSPIWTGHLTVLGCEIHSLPTPTFKRLISWSIETAGEEPSPRIALYGGMAVPDLQSHGAPDVKVAKLESYRVLVTFHPDATVRFWDASPHLLLLPTPLRFEYPGPLPHLTISIGEYLKHPDVAHLPLAKLWETDRSKVRIKSVHLAREALECVITLVTGEVIVTKFGESKKNAQDGDEVEELELDEDKDGGHVHGEGALGTPKNDSYFPSQSPLANVGAKRDGNKDEWVEEVTEIGHLARWKVDGFKPVAIFTLKRGEVVSTAVSDIGEFPFPNWLMEEKLRVADLYQRLHRSGVQLEVGGGPRHAWTRRDSPRRVRSGRSDDEAQEEEEP